MAMSVGHPTFLLLLYFLNQSPEKLLFLYLYIKVDFIRIIIIFKLLACFFVVLTMTMSFKER